MGVEWTELAFYGGSFTCLPARIRHDLYVVAKETGISTLRFSTSPDCINDAVLEESVANGVEIIELGVQSLDDEVLKANKRPYSSGECIRAFELVKKHVRKAGIQLMTGLLKESFSSFAGTVERAVLMGADYARIYPCVVLSETELAELYNAGEYVPLSLGDAVGRCAYAYIRLTAEGCDVIRVGLHDSESVKDSALAGAYHPAMGEMTKTVALATFFGMGGKLRVDQKYLNIVYGYGGVLKKMHRDKVEIEEGGKPDFRYITKFIMEKLGEDSQRKLQEQTACIAERFFCQADNR